MIDDSVVVDALARRMGRQAEWIARAPGRVNLIGEHVDYNGGFVLPVAIDREVKLAASAAPDDTTVRAYSIEYDETLECDLDALPRPGRLKGWQAYLVSVVDLFQKRGIALDGFSAVVSGDVPLGAGLSSSAAFSVCIATFLNELSDANMSPREIALLAQAAEHSEYIGVNCGIMDQFISAMGEHGKGFLIDCHNLESRPVAIDPSQTAILIVNSMKQRGLVDSEYNRRREECNAALARFSEWEGVDYPTLRHVPLDVFDRWESRLDRAIMRRARHVITENLRVVDFARAAESNNWLAAGDALYASHDSLRDDFEVSCKELDFLSGIARDIEGVFGCRMTGAGFGGCVVALVSPRSAEKARAEFARRFQRAFSVIPETYLCAPSPGATVRRTSPN